MAELHVPVASLLAKHRGTSASGIQHLERDILNLAGAPGHKGAGQLRCPVLWVRTPQWQCWCSSPRLVPAQQGGAFSSQAVISGAEGFALGQLLPSHRPRRGCGSPQQLTCLLPRRGLEQGGMARRRQAGTMGTSVFPCLLVILLTRCVPAGCAEGDDSASHSK